MTGQRQQILFSEAIDSKKFILFRIDKNLNNSKKQFIEISIIDGNLTASESQKDAIQINTKNFIIINEINHFVYKFDNIEKILTISINKKNIFSSPYNFSFNQNVFRTKTFEDLKNKISNANNQKKNKTKITIGYPL